MTASNETWHHGIIAAAVAVYQDATYVEIGVAGGKCLEAVAPHAASAIGVDPHGANRVRGATLFRMTSDAYFDEHPGLYADVFFIDGDHSFEQAERDFENAMERLAHGGMIFLHDTHPLSEVDTREKVACGDVWKLGAILADDPTYEVYRWTRFPGLMMVRRRDAAIHESSVV
jgi:hypothetical protein